MNKDFSEKKLLSMELEKQVKVLYDLANFIESSQASYSSAHFLKLKKYHNFLTEHPHERIQKLNKEFNKVKDLGRQFQLYIMHLERLLGQTKKEYQFLVKTGDSKKSDNEKTTTFPIICLLDSIRSAHNVGAIFRSSECFAVQEIILGGLTPAPDSPHVQKTAMGCDKLVKYRSTNDPVAEITALKKEGYTICSVEVSQNAQNLFELEQVPTPIVLIFGHEQFGVSQQLLEISDLVIQISLFGRKNSLNVSISHALVVGYLSKLLSQTNK